MERIKIVEQNIASKGQRFANHLIDTIVYYILVAALGTLILITNLESSFFIFDYNFLTRLLEILFYVFFMFCMETVWEGKSIGKFITGTKVVTEYGEIPTTNEILIRSFSRIVPFEAFSFLWKSATA